MIIERLIEGSGEENDSDINDSTSGLWVIVGIAIYALVILAVVLYCLNRQKNDEDCCPCGVTDLCMGQCSCLDSCNCSGTLPTLDDCCPRSDPDQPSCFSSLCQDCSCEPETQQPEPCCESGFLLGDCCKCQPSEEEIIERKMANDPDYFLKMLQSNPQFQRSLREQGGINQLNASQTFTTQPTSVFSTGTLNQQSTWSTINGSGHSMRLQTVSTEQSQSFT